MSSKGVGREALGVLLDLLSIFVHKAHVISNFDFCSGASGIDRAQNVQNSTAVAGFSKLRASEHAFFNAQRSFNGVIRVIYARVGEINPTFRTYSVRDLIGVPLI